MGPGAQPSLIPLAQRVAGWAVVALSVVALMFAAASGAQAKSVARCQAEAAEMDRAAFHQLVAAVLLAGETQDEQARLAALRSYLSTPPPRRCI